MVATNKSMADCIADNDFLAAKYRLENTNARWYHRWIETIETILNNSLEWSKKYCVQYGVLVKREISNYCYWVMLVDDNDFVIFNKIGTSNNPSRRFGELLRSKYCDDFNIIDVKIMKIWDCGEVNAEGLESYLRAMCIKEYGSNTFFSKDRFNINLEADKMDKWVSEYLGIA